MSSRRGKAVFGFGMAVFGAVVFFLATGYLIERGIPRWVAAGFGALAFPVLPVVWHLIGERRRRARVAAAKAPPKNALAPGDRYLLRAIAVTVLVLGPMFALGGLGVVKAGWRHKAFFLPVHVPTLLDGAGDVLSHVPSDAEAVLLLHDRRADTSASLPKLGVAAYRDRQLAIVAPRPSDTSDEDAIRAIHDQVLSKMPYLTSDKLEAVDLGDDLFAAATPKWTASVRATGNGPSTALRGELAAVPPDAVLAIAWLPSDPAKQFGIRSLTGWVTQRESGSELVVDGRIVVTSPDKAKAVREAFGKLRALALQLASEACRDKTEAVIDGGVVHDYGNTITYHLAIDPGRIADLMLCRLQTGAD